MKRLKSLGKIYQLGLSYPKIVLLICSLLTIVSFYLARQLKIEIDFAALLPPQTESMQNLNDLKKYFGNTGHLILTVEANDSAVAKDFSEKFSKRIENLPEVRYVDYKRPVDFFQNRKWLFVDLKDLKEMEHRIDRSLELQNLGISPVFNHLMDFADKNDRPDLTFRDIQDKYTKRYEMQMSSYLSDKEDKFHILRVKVKKGAENLEYNKSLIAHIKLIANQLKQDKSFKTVQVGYTGSYQTNIESIELIRHEMTLVSVIVFILLIVILYMYFGRLSGAFLIGLPLAMGVIWTGGFVYFVLGHFNIITAFAISILAGLGSDYGIYLLSRFFKESSSGQGFETACYLTFNKIGRVTFIAMLTTVGAFAALLFSGFQAFIEFGIVGGSGLILNYLVMMLVLPSCLKLAKDHSNNKLINWLIGWNGHKPKKVSEQLSFFNKIFNTRWAKALVILFIILCGVSAFSAPNFNQLHYEDGQIAKDKLPSNRLYKRVWQTLKYSLFPAVILVSNAESEKKTVWELNKQLEQTDKNSLVFDRVLGLSSFIPNDQEQKITILKQIALKYQNNKYIKGKQKEAFLKDIDQTIQLGTFSRQDIPKEVSRNFISPKDSNYHAVYMFPSISRDKIEGMKRYREGIINAKLKSNIDFVPVDGSFIAVDIINILISKAPRGILMVLVFLSCVLFLTLRQTKITILILVHLIGSLLLVSGVLFLTGIQLNVFNIAVFPIILGAGLDSFIHFNQRFQETQSLTVAMRDEIPAIFMANLTSIVGFGSLIFTSSAGLRSIGWVALIGLIIITIVCTFIFPRSLLLFSVGRVGQWRVFALFRSLFKSRGEDAGY